MPRLVIDMKYVSDMLIKLLAIPSPTGYTDAVVHFVAEELSRLGIPRELTRRGAIRAKLAGKDSGPARAVVCHLDTLGMIVKALKPNGRMSVAPIGHWSSRFAEGARTRVFTDERSYRATALPLKASGHTFNKEIDSQPVAWENLELRVDMQSDSLGDLIKLGFHVGDIVAVDAMPEIDHAGYVNSRHLDDKAGVATVLGAAKALRDAEADLPVDCHLLFTISEEVGSGASAVLHQNVSEMVAVDNSTCAPGQNSIERGVTVAIADTTGPFDYHLTRALLHLCAIHEIPHARDVFRYYRCDAASAIEAGADIRTALVCFGCDASHGYERTHLDSLRGLGELLALYIQSPRTASRDRLSLGPLAGLPSQHG